MDLNDNEINEDDNDTGNIINGFANCIDTINRIQTDEMMKDAMLLPDQIQMVNNFKEDQKNRYLLKNSVAKLSDSQISSSSNTD